MRIPIKLSVGNQIIETTTIIDCGATRNFINLELISLTKFPLQHLQRPIKAYNIDGTTNFQGNIIWKTQVDILFTPREKTSN